MKNLNEQLRDVARQREAALAEVIELKTQLKLVEETRDAIRRDLIDANRAVREGDSCFLAIASAVKPVGVSLVCDTCCFFFFYTCCFSLCTIADTITL